MSTGSFYKAGFTKDIRAVTQVSGDEWVIEVDQAGREFLPINPTSPIHALARLTTADSLQSEIVKLTHTGTSGSAVIESWASGAYENNLNITHVLSIPGESTLAVDIYGATEFNYDFLYIDVDAVEIRSYTGNNISDHFTVSGDSITIRFTSDGSVNNDGVTVQIQSIASGEAEIFLTRHDVKIANFADFTLGTLELFSNKSHLITLLGEAVERTRAGRFYKEIPALSVVSVVEKWFGVEIVIDDISLFDFIPATESLPVHALVKLISSDLSRLEIVRVFSKNISENKIIGDKWTGESLDFTVFDNGAIEIFQAKSSLLSAFGSEISKRLLGRFYNLAPQKNIVSAVNNDGDIEVILSDTVGLDSLPKIESQPQHFLAKLENNGQEEIIRGFYIDGLLGAKTVVFEGRITNRDANDPDYSAYAFNSELMISFFAEGLDYSIVTINVEIFDHIIGYVRINTNLYTFDKTAVSIDYESTTADWQDIYLSFDQDAVDSLELSYRITVSNGKAFTPKIIGDRWSNPTSNFADFSGGVFELFKSRSELSATIYHSVKNYFTSILHNSASARLTAFLHNSSSSKLISPIAHGVSSKLIASFEMSSIVRGKLVSKLSHSVRMRGRLTSVTENKKDRVRGRLTSVAEHEIEQTNTILVDVAKNIIKEI